jgi:hypothetical protein
LLQQLQLEQGAFASAAGLGQASASRCPTTLLRDGGLLLLLKAHSCLRVMPLCMLGHLLKLLVHCNLNCLMTHHRWRLDAKLPFCLQLCLA